MRHLKKKSLEKLVWDNLPDSLISGKDYLVLSNKRNTRFILVKDKKRFLCDMSESELLEILPGSVRNSLNNEYLLAHGYR